MVEQITSEQLEKLLISFKLDIPEDPQNESFVREIVTKDLIQKWIYDIKSLSKEVRFTRDGPKKADVRSSDVYAVEVDVVCTQNGLSVINKV